MSSEGQTKKRIGRGPFRFLLFVLISIGTGLALIVVSDRLALAKLRQDARSLGLPLTRAELQLHREKNGRKNDITKHIALYSLLEHSAFDTDGNFKLKGDIRTIREKHPEFFNLVTEALTVTPTDLSPVSDRPHLIYNKSAAVLIKDITLSIEESDFDRARQSGSTLNDLLRQAAIVGDGIVSFTNDWFSEATHLVAKYGVKSQEAQVIKEILADYPDDVQTVRTMYEEFSVYPDGDQATPSESLSAYAHRVYEARLENGVFSTPIEVGWGFMEAHAPGYKDRMYRSNLTLVVRTLKALPPSPSDDLFTNEYEKQLDLYIRKKEPGWTDLIETRGWAAGFATTQSDRIKRRDGIIASIR